MYQHYPFTLTPLPYAFNALEPVINLQTLLLHHNNHQQSYVDGLNAALEFYPRFHDWSLEHLLAENGRLPLKIQPTVARNAGGLYNHQLYFEAMASPVGQQPGPVLGEALVRTFGSVEDFFRRFRAAATGQFASGWCWLAVDPSGRLRIITTPNHDTLFPRSLTPIFLTDVWEHAYYLQYKNRRNDFLGSWFSLIDWAKAEALYRQRMGLSSPPA